MMKLVYKLQAEEYKYEIPINYLPVRIFASSPLAVVVRRLKLNIIILCWSDCSDTQSCCNHITGPVWILQNVFWESLRLFKFF